MTFGLSPVLMAVGAKPIKLLRVVPTVSERDPKADVFVGAEVPTSSLSDEVSAGGSSVACVLAKSKGVPLSTAVRPMRSEYECVRASG